MRKEEKIHLIRYYLAVPLLVFGILMLAVPSFDVNTVCTVFGALLSVFGLAELFLFLTDAKIRYRLILGILGAVLGAVLVSVRAEFVVVLAQLLVGVFVAVDGTYKFRLSVEIFNRGARLWGAPLAISIAMVVFGILVIFWPATGSFMPSLFGIAILVDSIGELLLGLYNGGDPKGNHTKRQPTMRNQKRNR